MAERIARFHLVDNTRGEPPFWRKEEVRRSDLVLTVAEATKQRIELRLEGRVLLATDADLAQATRGFDVRLLGQIHLDRSKHALQRFDIVAVGDHWGEGTFTGNARAGRKPLGLVFELAAGDVPGQVPPQAIREIGAYLGTGK